jgi:Rps23 Pro-64 3,4-dihydroxylase Tpa1-like proline 4-hydroxylase
MRTAEHTLDPVFDADLNADIERITAQAALLNAAYTQATPFPHIVIEDFLPPALIDEICRHFPAETTANEKLYERGYKGQFKRQINPNQCDAYLRNVFAAFNSAPMLQFLETLTGIQGLIPDPYFNGGGLHETSAGGYLGVHADFRVHKPLQIVRRINIIIYLNPDWQEAYGGHLELWDKSMTTCLKKVLPNYNRCVVFNTDEDSNHGHPEPLTPPPGVTRRSIALYYYTASYEMLGAITRSKTDYKARPKDKRNVRYLMGKLFKKKA